MQNGPDGLFHILYGHPFLFAVESMPAGKNIGAGQAHERKTRAVRSTADTPADRLHARAADGFQSDFHDQRIAVEYLFHVAVLLRHVIAVAATGMPGYDRLDDFFQFLFVAPEVIVIEIADDKFDRSLFYATLYGYGMHKAFALTGRLG